MPFTFTQVLATVHSFPHIVTGDSAGYMVLSLAEQWAASPRTIAPASIALEASGRVRLLGPQACDPLEADRQLRGVLRSLLQPLAAPPESLQHVASAPPVSPSSLQHELTAVLIPLNHAAAKRALTRLYRRMASLEGVVEPAFEADAPPRGATESDAPDVESEIDIEVVEASETWWQTASSSPSRLALGPSERETGTPILGSIDVLPRAELERLAVEERGREERAFTETILGAPVALRAAAGEQEALPRAPDPSPSVGPSQEALEHDTEVDAVVHVDEWSVPVLGYHSQRSQITTLVEQFQGAPYFDEEDVKRQLRRLVEAAATDVVTPTPPPVERASAHRYQVTPTRRLGRAGMALALAVFGSLLAMTVVWFAKPAKGSGASPLQATSGCQADVRVLVPSDAFVYLNDDQHRQEQSGPVAFFAAVACDSHAEVTVRLADAAESDAVPTWVRMPLPEHELGHAATSGQPLTISPLQE